MTSPTTFVVLLANDLMLSSTVSGFAAQAGRAFHSVGSVSDVVAAIGENPAALLLVDLGTPGLDVASLAESIPADVLQRAVAYGPHVHTEKLQAATKAGCGKVMSRGQFSAQVSTLIADS
jgi:DNA-binding NarL/FixJ family response regulator